MKDRTMKKNREGQNCKSPICIAGDSAAGVASTLSAGHFLALLPRVFTDS